MSIVKKDFKYYFFAFLKYAVLVFSSCTMVLPFLWMLSASIKPDLDVFAYPIQWIPKNPTWSNYAYVWNKVHYLRLFLNTAKLMIVITGLQVFTCSLAAYALSKIKYPERDKIFLAYLATLMVPFQVIMISQFIIIRKLGLADTHMALILIGAFSPMGVFLYKQFYMGIPEELSEAARIDGLSEFGIYSKIIFPLSHSATATLVILTSVNVWNDFLAPLIYINSSKKMTIQLGLRSLITEYSAEYGPIMAASVISIIPLIIVFIICQKQFVEGIATHGIKG